ncbi:MULTISPECIES: hypothetical protein [Brenneria]|uniref:Uncharacterized protein n=1 Tax=Brenneria nigrifluens DSM 30175 = ATCC 13028 TaxID=1121120 RepID=A0A2U1USS4_9GAMM|nr:MULTISPECIES: hypothetical protein [Brenneria]EHD21529.1 hypothetical protein BrE312_2146 [Brenneria sp. EniD312]PWC24684.1 hypothetical protein DDT54_08330 [Brenneria nigrifluens DSM 30175 = ATCC 13028]QCR04651.1 hypothetical protein EH206_10995 [Brenneria nigrifluens DSM 30175 = ATCC 13028]
MENINLATDNTLLVRLLELRIAYINGSTDVAPWDDLACDLFRQLSNQCIKVADLEKTLAAYRSRAVKLPSCLDDKFRFGCDFMEVTYQNAVIAAIRDAGIPVEVEDNAN